MTPLLLLALAAAPDATAEPGPFTRHTVNRIVRRHAGELRTCAERHWGFDVEITLTFTVSPEGRVRDVTTESITQTDSSDLLSCVITSLRNWSFPSPGKKSATVEHYVFRLPPTPPKK